MFRCEELTLLFYSFKLKSQNDVGQGGRGDSSTGQKKVGEEDTERNRIGKGLRGDSSIGQKKVGEEETERNRIGKGLRGDIQRKEQKNTRGQDRIGQSIQ